MKRLCHTLLLAISTELSLLSAWRVTGFAFVHVHRMPCRMVASRNRRPIQFNLLPYFRRIVAAKTATGDGGGDSAIAIAVVVLTGTVTIVDQSERYLVVNKPPSVVCHHSDWAGSRKGGQQPEERYEIPMLQRIRQALGGRHVNLVHRLDRGCSGCLLTTFSDDSEATNLLSEAMTTRSSTADDDDGAMNCATSCKTYVAIVRGEGILHDRDLKKEGWFLVDRPIRNERGELKNATTWFRFVAGQASSEATGNGQQQQQPRASLVLARPITGRWHQIRRHLNGLSHPILGDSSHGNSHVNREWREQRGLPYQRTCLHLLRLQIPPNPVAPKGIDAFSELPADMMNLLKLHLPRVLKEAIPILEQEEGIHLLQQKEEQDSTVILPFEIKIGGEESFRD